MRRQGFKVYSLWLGFVMVCLYTEVGFSQNQAIGKMVKENGHYIAALDFFGTYSQVPKGRISRVLSQWKDDSFLLREEEYRSNDILVSGLVEGAVLVVDWWTLFNEPTENYTFQWSSSGKYRVEYRKDRGSDYQKKWVNRQDLLAYPDLLKRFDALQPLDLHFEINWELDNLSAVYGENTSVYSKIKTTNFTTQIKSGMLFEPSGKKPFSVPGIRQGKGHDFLGLPSDYNLAEVGEIFKCMTGENRADIKIWNFKVIHARWPVEEMRAIAQLYEDYKDGKKDPTPLEQVALADRANAHLNTYTKQDFWSETFEEENGHIEVFNELYGGKMGIKKNGSVIFERDRNHGGYYIQPIDDKSKYFLVKEDRIFRIIDQRGNSLRINGFEVFSDAIREKDQIIVFAYLNDFEFVKVGRVPNWLTTSDDKIKPSYIKGDVYLWGFVEQAKTIRDVIDRQLIVVEHKSLNSRYGVGKYLMLTVNSQFQVISEKIVYTMVKEESL